LVPFISEKLFKRGLFSTHRDVGFLYLNLKESLFFGSSEASFFKASFVERLYRLCVMVNRLETPLRSSCRRFENLPDPREWGEENHIATRTGPPTGGRSTRGRASNHSPLGAVTACRRQ